MLALGFVLGLMAAPAAASTVTISEPTIVNEAGTPIVDITSRDGVGALFLSTPDGADKATVGVTDAGGTTLGALESLSYRALRQQGPAGVPQQPASINVTVWPWAGTFVSWGDIIAGHEDSTVIAIMVNQGSGNAGLQSYVDWVEVDGTTYDFAPAPTCFVDVVRDGATVASTHSVQDAVNQAAAADTLLISGTCEERVVVSGKAGLTLTSADPTDPATIDAGGQGTGNTGHVLRVTSPGVTVSELVVTGSGVNADGISIGAAGVTAAHNLVTGNSRWGIGVGNSGATVSHNDVTGNGDGIYVAGPAGDNTINHNTSAANSRWDIVVLGTSNVVHHNEAGQVRTQPGSAGNSVRHNSMTSCTMDGTDNVWFRNAPADCNNTGPGGR